MVEGWVREGGTFISDCNHSLKIIIAFLLLSMFYITMHVPGLFKDSYIMSCSLKIHSHNTLKCLENNALDISNLVTLHCVCNAQLVFLTV